MNRTGIIIVSSFAFLWFVFAKINGAAIPALALLIPCAFSALLVGIAWRQNQGASDLPAEEQRRIGRVFMWSSIGEGIGIFVIINILVNIGMVDRYMAGLAVAVGLHFIPIALCIPRRIYMALAAVFLAIAIAGFLITSPHLAALVVGCCGAVSLWGYAVMAIMAQTRLQGNAAN